MAATFDKDMNIITNFLKDMDIIAALDDQPNDVGGLTAAELKAKFDEGGKAIQEYINGTLIPEVLGLDGTEASRQAAETARAEAETQRQQAEEQRLSAESARSSAEAARIQAESERLQAEESRISAETARIQAEQQRADETAGIVARATEQAELAGTRATSAISSMNEAAASAAAAAEQATAASGSAAAAAQSAQAIAQSQALSQSWAVGGTGQRDGEDTNNAKYWAEKAQDLSGGGSGKKTCRLVVGTSTAGWMESDCDYLCDGQEDEVEIQAAVNALPAEGGTIVLLEGTYDLLDWVVVEKDRVEIRGAGPAVTIDSNVAVPLSTAFNLKGNYCALRNIRLLGGRLSGAWYQEGIQIEGSHCTVDSVVIEDAAQSIIIKSTGSWATVQNCTMPACFTCDASYLRLLNNCFERNLIQDAINATNTVSIGATCYRCIGNFIDGHSLICTGSYGVIADNDVVGPEDGAAILLQGKQLLCHDNVAAFFNDAATYTGKTIQITGTDCIVTGNLTRLKEISDESGGDTNLLANNKVIVA